MKRPATFGQENALRFAEECLAESAFSKQGLADELEEEGFSRIDIRFAINHIHADWYEQAALAARMYLSYSVITRQGLIDQLSSSHGDAFTIEQAKHGAENH